jgi:MFS family permease
MEKVEPEKRQAQRPDGTAEVKQAAGKYSFSVAAICMMSLGIDAMAVRSVSLLAPYIRSNLNISDSQFGFIFSALTAGTLISALPTGMLINRVKTNWAFGGIMAGLGLALFNLARQDAFTGLIVALFLMGLVRTGIIPLVNRVVTERYDPAQRGARMGVIYAAVPFGGVIGAILLPTIAQYISWSTGYLLLGGAALAGGLAAWKLVPSTTGSQSQPQSSRSSAGLRSSAFIVLCVTYGVFVISLSTDAFLTLYLVDVVKISALVAGTLFGLIQLSAMGGRVFWGYVADRYFSKNRWWPLAATNLLTVSAFALLISLNPGSKWWMLAAVMVLIGISGGSSWVVLSTLVGDVVGIASIAMASATIFFSTNIADVFGPIIFSQVHQLVGNYQTVVGLFTGFAVLTTLTFIGMALRWQKRKSPANPPAS